MQRTHQKCPPTPSLTPHHSLLPNGHFYLPSCMSHFIVARLGTHVHLVRNRRTHCAHFDGACVWRRPGSNSSAPVMGLLIAFGGSRREGEGNGPSPCTSARTRDESRGCKAKGVCLVPLRRTTRGTKVLESISCDKLDGEDGRVRACARARWYGTGADRCTMTWRHLRASSLPRRGKSTLRWWRRNKK
ncbi:hypothetical protein CBOM_07799 [Ceraceosorus bombacis]|uniref:Uncharacterized protein n=1 Tax=Ceraceosorus bombacis TaxID=401625 RepID=A0A0P1BNC4_9BASI|nr:hypothetical protein CBOM_07799 [Ceraceosorus bombacis]